MAYETLNLTVSGGVASVSLNRPDKRNALTEQSWRELEALFRELDERPEVRAIVLSGEGKHFCAGIDLGLLMSVPQRIQDGCDGRAREKLRRLILELQAPINAIEACRKPVLAAVHGACVGAGVDIIAACDMRYATEDAYFAIAEVDMGLVADLGSLQRLPRLIGEGMTREMAYTGRKVGGAEAAAIGLINRTYPDREGLLAAVLDLAAGIAAKSPLVIRGTKEMLNYGRDHSVAEGLNMAATWNAAMLLSNDLMEAFQVSLTKRPPEFAD